MEATSSYNLRKTKNSSVSSKLLDSSNLDNEVPTKYTKPNETLGPTMLENVDSSEKSIECSLQQPDISLSDFQLRENVCKSPQEVLTSIMEKIPETDFELPILYKATEKECFDYDLEESKKLCSEFQNILTKKIDQMDVSEVSKASDSLLKSVLEKLKSISNLQTQFLKEEKVQLELARKLLELNNRQKILCHNMLKSIRVIEKNIEELTTFKEKDKLESEIQEFGKKQRDILWRTYLKKQLEGLKSAIVNNLKLD